MLSFIFVCVCGLFEWKPICTIFFYCFFISVLLLEHSKKRYGCKCLFVSFVFGVNISAVSWQSVLLVEEFFKPSTCHKSLTNVIIKCCIDYTSPWTGFELTTNVVIGTDYTGSCKFNYCTITRDYSSLKLDINSSKGKAIWLHVTVTVELACQKGSSDTIFWFIPATITCLSKGRTLIFIDITYHNHLCIMP